MGPVVTYLEQQGICTEIGQYNEEIKQFNRVLQSLKSRLGFFDERLSDFVDRMLAKNPDVRPDNWYEVAEFLRKIELNTKNQKL